MNGPTRSSSFQGRPSVEGGTSRGRTTAVLDELDQFVDSEPAVWPSAPGTRRAGTARTDGIADTGVDRPQTGGGHARNGVETDVEAAFSRLPAGSRRDVFAQRLDAALAKPPESRKSTQQKRTESSPARETVERDRARRGERPAERGPGLGRVDGQPSDQRGHRGRDAEEPRRRERDAFARSAAEAVSGMRRATGRAGAGAGPPRRDNGEPRRTDTAQSSRNRERVRESWQGLTPQSTRAPASPPDLAEPGLEAHGVVEPGGAEEPEDALDWEIGNAIRGIVHQSRPRAGDDTGSGNTAEGPSATDDQGASVPRQETAHEEPAGDVAPHREMTGDAPASPTAARQAPGPIGTKRAKPIPTFHYERAEETDTAFPAAPPDMDDPLSSVFFADVRNVFDEAHAGAGRNRRSAGGAGNPNDDGDDSDDGAHLSELDQDDEFDPGSGSDRGWHGDDDRLPRSLSRSVRGARRKPQWRTAAIAAVVGGVAVVGVLGVFGIGVFTGNGAASRGGAEPPVIKADARDVKERPEESDSAARPGVMEQTELTGQEVLNVPDRVRIRSDPGAGSFGTEREESASPADVTDAERRRVRTVVVRADGSIVPVREGEDAASAGAGPAAPSAATAFRPEGGGERSATGEDAEAPAASGRGSGTRSATAADGSRADPMGYAAPDAAAPRAASETDRVVDRDDTDAASASGSDAGPGEDAAVESGGAVPVPRERPDGVLASGGGGSARGVRTDTQDNDGRRVAAADGTAQGSDGAAQTASADAPWGVQLASRRSRSAAERSFSALETRYPSLLQGLSPMISRAEVAGRGTFYRVRIAARSRGEAAAFCQRLKAAGADCFIDRN